MATTTLLLVRHGETDDNKNHVFQGQGGRGLNPRGRDQVTRLANRLVRAKSRPAALYASDLDRARETAEILGRAVGLSPVLDPDLRELFLGAWQGLTDTEVSTRFPAEWGTWRTGQDLRRGGGESYADLATRVERALGRIADAHAGETVVVVSHGASIKIFAARVLGLGTEQLRNFRVTVNTGVSLIERDADGRYRLLVWNDVAHLHDPVLEVLGG